MPSGIVVFSSEEDLQLSHSPSDTDPSPKSQEALFHPG